MKIQDTPIEILLVEDSDIDAALVRGHLDKGGVAYSLKRTSNRATFLDALEAGGFDVVITDYALPDLDGLDVTAMVRDYCEEIPVVVISGVQGEDFATAAFRCGASDYVLKRTLGRLPTVLLRALREARVRVRRRMLEDMHREQQEQYRCIFESSSDAILIFDVDGSIVQANPAACTIHKYTYDELIGRNGRDLVHPADHAKFGALLETYKSGEPFRAQAMHVSKQGDYIYVGVRGSVFMHSGKPQLLAVLRDITQQKRAQEQQALLVRELSHRVKNTLATVQSIINFTLRMNDDVTRFQESISSRIESLAKSHNLLTDNEWKGASLRQLLHNELSPYDDGSRVMLDGADLDLPSDMALMLGMVLHEMTTNAVKYGAFMTDTGRLTVRWAVGRGKDVSLLKLTWKESGGPAVSPPTRQGFGSILIGRMVAHQLNGTVNLDYPPDGVELSLTATVPDSVPPFDSAYRIS